MRFGSLGVLAVRLIRAGLRRALFLCNRHLGGRSGSSGKIAPPVSDRTEAEKFLLAVTPKDTEGRAYFRDHLERLVDTLLVIPQSEGTGRALELGSYLQIPPALVHLRGYRTVHAAYLGSGESFQQLVRTAGWPDITCEVDLFDAQSDVFPYPDGYFELVLAAEIVEHLGTDPMHMLYEIHRVLAADGVLVLTTPNCVSMQSLANALWGRHNPFVFSGFPKPEAGEVEPGARHAREYTPWEIGEMLRCSGFGVEYLWTIDRPSSQRERPRIDDLLANYGYPTELRGEQLMCVARKKEGNALVRYPDWLYPSSGDNQ